MLKVNDHLEEQHCSKASGSKARKRQSSSLGPALESFPCPSFCTWQRPGSTHSSLSPLMLLPCSRCCFLLVLGCPAEQMGITRRDPAIAVLHLLLQGNGAAVKCTTPRGQTPLQRPAWCSRVAPSSEWRPWAKFQAFSLKPPHLEYRVL